MRTMKNSGVEWIGEIPSDWEIIRNKNVFLCTKELVGQKSFTTQLLSLTTKGVKEKDINNAEGKLPESFDTYQYVKKNDIVMCLFDLDVSAVFSGISLFDGMISPAYKVITCKQSIIPRFADYWFRYISDGRKFNHFAKNIRYTLSYEDFSSLPFPLPPRETQQRIADFLDKKCGKIDEIIEREQVVIEKLKEYKQSVITEAVTKGLNPHAEMKDSGIEWIGKIPKDWNVAKAKYCITIENGSDPKTEGDVLVYGSGATSFKTCGEYKNGPTVLIGRKGTLHIPHYIEGKFWNVDTAFNVYTKSNYFLRYYFYCANVFDYWYYMSQTTLPSMTQTNYSNMSIPFPCLIEQQQIADYLDNKCAKIDKSIEAKQSVIDKLTEYKKSLIYEVVTGKKEV